MNSRSLKVVGIIVAFLGIQVAAANTQASTAASVASEEVPEVGVQTETIRQALLRKSRSNVVRAMNGKVFEHSYNKYGQLTSAKRIGGARFHFLYAHPSDTVPYKVKVGKRSSKLANDVPLSGAGTPAPTLHEDLQPDAISGAFEMQRYSATVTLLSSTSDGLQKDEIDDLLDELDDLGLLGASEVQDLTDIYVLEVIEIRASALTGYCQSSTCSFPSLEACMLDCDRTKDWAGAVCGGIAAWNGPAGAACGAVVVFGYYNICRPGCQAGVR
jgi:hypothetical protein